MNLVPARLTRDGGLRVVADDGAFAVRAPVAWAAILDGGAERRILFGVRPEHLRIEPAGSLSSGISARLGLVGPMGAELYLSLRARAHDLMARVPPQPLPPVGTEIVLGLDEAHLHCFDADTGARLS